MFKFRASQIGKIMTDPRNKGEILSEGAKTEIKKMAKELVYGFTEVVSNKYMDKGIQVEPESLALYNSVFFTDHKKNEERKTNEFITGECDIFTGRKIIDLKSCWSLATFPVTAEDGENKIYEWQCRAYMWLWDCEESEVAYCMVNTPPELIGWEQEELHHVEHIAAQLRVTRMAFTRDRSLEDKMAVKVKAANEYMDAIVRQIAKEHE